MCISSPPSALGSRGRPAASPNHCSRHPSCVLQQKRQACGTLQHDLGGAVLCKELCIPVSPCHRPKRHSLLFLLEPVSLGRNYKPSNAAPSCLQQEPSRLSEPCTGYSRLRHTEAIRSRREGPPPPKVCRPSPRGGCRATWLARSMIPVSWEDQEERTEDKPQSVVPRCALGQAFLSLRSEQGHLQSSLGHKHPSEPDLASTPTPQLISVTWDRHLS